MSEGLPEDKRSVTFEIRNPRCELGTERALSPNLRGKEKQKAGGTDRAPEDNVMICGGDCPSLELLIIDSLPK